MEDVLNCDNFLVYLNHATWTSGATSEAFAQEVERAMAAGVHLLLCHEMPGPGQERAPRLGCEFAEFFAHPDGATPHVLLSQNIYKQIACPLKGGAHREVSMAIVAQAITAISSGSAGPTLLRRLGSSTRMGSSQRIGASTRSDDEEVGWWRNRARKRSRSWGHVLGGVLSRRSSSDAPPKYPGATPSSHEFSETNDAADAAAHLPAEESAAIDVDGLDLDYGRDFFDLSEGELSECSPLYGQRSGGSSPRRRSSFFPSATIPEMAPVETSSMVGRLPPLPPSTPEGARDTARGHLSRPPLEGIQLSTLAETTIPSMTPESQHSETESLHELSPDPSSAPRFVAVDSSAAPVGALERGERRVSGAL